MEATRNIRDLNLRLVTDRLVCLQLSISRYRSENESGMPP